MKESLNDLIGNIQYYYHFYISAKENSFSEAGKKNNISSSSLTRSVSQLEDILDLKLVNTTNKGFTLTNDGERIYKELDKFFNNINTFTSKQLSSDMDVILTIGTTRNIADFFLAPLLTKYSKKYPKVKLSIITDNASNLDDYLVNHKIDVLIDYLPHINYTEKFELDIKPIGEYKTCFACSKEYYNKIKDKINNLSDLSNYELVVPGGSRRRQVLDEYLQKRNIKLNFNHFMPDSKLMADYVKLNDCIGYFIDSEIKEYDLVKLNIKDELPSNLIGIIYPKKTINHTAKNFVNVVLDNN